MLSKYGAMAEDAALLRGDRKLAEDIASERKNTPCISLKQLAVNGNDLISAGIPPRQLGGIMNALLEAVIEDQSRNQREILIIHAKALAKLNS
jgi:tRNA nucleotidyltransferase (CCA-adding enzyme)